MSNAVAKYLFPAMFLLLPPVALIVPMGMVPLFTLSAVGALLLLLEGEGRKDAFPVALALCLGLSMLWAAVSTLWAPAPLSGFLLVLRVSLIFAAGLVLLSAASGKPAPDTGKREARAIIAGGAFFLALLAFEILSQGMVTTFVHGPLPEGANPANLLNPGGAVLGVICWPCALVLWRRVHVLAAAAFLGLVFLCLLKVAMGAAMAAFLVGGAAFLATALSPRRVAFGLLVVLVAVILLGPPFCSAFFDLTAYIEEFPSQRADLTHRLVIWQFVLERIAERPFLGWGFDASRSFSGGKTVIELTHGMGPAVPAPVLPLHPHSGLLQVWLELGLPGAVLAAALVAIILRNLARSAGDPKAAATFAAVFCSFLTLAMLSFGIWQNWWLATAWLAAAGAVIAARRAAPETRPAKE